MDNVLSLSNLFETVADQDNEYILRDVFHDVEALSGLYNDPDRWNEGVFRELEEPVQRLRDCMDVRFTDGDSSDSATTSSSSDDDDDDVVSFRLYDIRPYLTRLRQGRELVKRHYARDKPDETQEEWFECVICSIPKLGRVMLSECGHALCCRDCTDSLSNCSVCRREIGGATTTTTHLVYLCQDGKRVNDCCVCFDPIKRRVHFSPCCHAYTCETCSRTLNSCPICDMFIKRKTIVYIDV